MSNVRDIKHLLGKLPTKYRDKALANMNRQRYRLDEPIQRIEDALDVAFTWSETPEGADFWAYISNRLSTLTAIKSLLTDKLRCHVFGTNLYIVARLDQVYGDRIYLQVQYTDKCRVTGEFKTWHGRKWYLSDHMMDDEIIKTAYAAFKAAVEHEVMEGFTYDYEIVFNPHTPVTALMKAAKEEASRKEFYVKSLT